MIKVCASTAIFPGFRFVDAVSALVSGWQDPFWGILDISMIQLCPQNYGLLDETVLDRLQTISPKSQFRLHANCRVFDRHPKATVASFDEASKHEYVRLAELSKRLGANVYTLHAGLKSDCANNLGQLRENYWRIQDIFGEIRVGIEGHYPERGSIWMLDDWNDLEWMLESDMAYVIDLSHFNIVAKRKRLWREDLIRCALSNERCLEVHVSGNDGYHDQHLPVHGNESWLPMIDSIHPNAVIFSEGRRIDVC